jgi:hypothetical protein
MSASRIAAWLGAGLVLRRLRGRAMAVIALGTVVFSTLAAFAERRSGALDAAGRALQGPVFGLAIPIAMLSLVSMAFSRTRLERSLASIALIGASRRAAVWGAIPSVAIVGAFLTSLTAAVATLAAHGFRAPGAPGDAASAAWVAALASAAYAAYYAAASTIGDNGRGRYVAFVADLTLGPLAGAAAFPFPRAHALNLLGAEPVLNLPQPASAATLACLTLIFATIASWRTSP